MIDKQFFLDGGVIPVNLNTAVGYLISEGVLPKSATRFPGKTPETLATVLKRFERCDGPGDTAPLYLARPVSH